MNGVCCLTVAGSDCGGNAGVQADLRTFRSYGIHGCTVFTALTAQNPFGVSGILDVGADFIGKQLDAVLGVYDIRAVKTGMMSSAEAIRAVSGRLSSRPGIPIVVDPVMVATSGADLMAKGALEAAEKELFPIAALLTPNIPEAETISGRTPGAVAHPDRDYAERLALEISDRFGIAVLVKGGHGAESESTDVLACGGGTASFSLPWIKNPVSTHGTGCTLSSAIACELALGRNLEEAVSNAKKYVHDAIAKSYLVGKNCGVLGNG